jgi:hypothetical protein
MRHLAPALAQGLRCAFTGWRLLAIMLLANLAFALVALLPVAMALDQVLSPMGDWQGVMARWPAWLDADFQAHSSGAVELFRQQTALLLVLFTLLSTFLTAGVMGVLHDADGAFSLGSFFRGCGRYGFAFLRLLGVFLVAAWLLAWLAGAQLGALVDSLRFDWPSLRGATLLTAAHQAVVVGLFYLLVWATEMGRVRLVVEKRRSALGAFLAGVSITGRKLAAVGSLFATLALLQMIFLAAAGWLIRRWTPDSVADLILFFLVGQAVILGRIALRIAGLESGRRWFLRGQA